MAQSGPNFRRTMSAGEEARTRCSITLTRSRPRSAASHAPRCDVGEHRLAQNRPSTIGRDAPIAFYFSAFGHSGHWPTCLLLHRSSRRLDPKAGQWTPSAKSPHCPSHRSGVFSRFPILLPLPYECWPGGRYRRRKQRASGVVEARLL